MSDRRYCNVCDRWVGGGIGHGWDKHEQRTIGKLLEKVQTDD